MTGLADEADDVPQPIAGGGMMLAVAGSATLRGGGSGAGGGQDGGEEGPAAAAAAAAASAATEAAAFATAAAVAAAAEEAENAAGRKGRRGRAAKGRRDSDVAGEAPLAAAAVAAEGEWGQAQGSVDALPGREFVGRKLGLKGVGKGTITGVNTQPKRWPCVQDGRRMNARTIANMCTHIFRCCDQGTNDNRSSKATRPTVSEQFNDDPWVGPWVYLSYSLNIAKSQTSRGLACGLRVLRTPGLQPVKDAPKIHPAWKV